MNDEIRHCEERPRAALALVVVQAICDLSVNLLFETQAASFLAVKY